MLTRQALFGLWTERSEREAWTPPSWWRATDVNRRLSCPPWSGALRIPPDLMISMPTLMRGRDDPDDTLEIVATLVS